jgi:hypothetical protein
VNTGVTLEGQVKGDGGFVSGTFNTANLGGWLQLACPTNAFAGGIDFAGRAGLGELGVTGGVSLIANGAVPSNGAPFKIKNAALHLYHSNTYSANTYDLPDLVVDGRATITNATSRLSASTVRASPVTSSLPSPATSRSALATRLSCSGTTITIV